ncbi:MAG: YncE family protein, partial [Candidatus Methylomirabilales bacterium]
LAARIPQGKRPDLLWFTPDGKEAWVTNRHAGTVSVIDVETLQTVAVIPVGPNPHGIVIVP